jgi:RNA polymerase sigma-70 factor (ECF subfamily)
MSPWRRSAEWKAETMMESPVVSPLPMPGTAAPLSRMADRRKGGRRHALHISVVERAVALVPGTSPGRHCAGWRSPTTALRVPFVDALTRLALAARDGDRHALEGFVEGSYEQVWRLCAKLVDDQGADDLAQEAYARAVKALPKFRGESSARTWLLAIARNTCMDELRTRGRRRRRDTSLLAASRHRQDVAAADHRVGVADIVARLTPERREAFVLTQMLGLSYHEAAQVCACPTGTIRSRVARARADLLASLSEADAGRRSAQGYSNESSMYPMATDMTS